MAKRLPQIPANQVQAPSAGGLDFDTCGDPDRGDRGIARDPASAGPRGGAPKRRQAMASNAATADGLGHYIRSSPSSDLDRVSDVLHHARDPHLGSDGRILAGKHQRGNGTCDLQPPVLSNEHLLAGAERERRHDGGLDGSVRGCRGRRYLGAPEEFILESRPPSNRAMCSDSAWISTPRSIPWRSWGRPAGRPRGGSSRRHPWSSIARRSAMTYARSSRARRSSCAMRP